MTAQAKPGGITFLAADADGNHIELPFQPAPAEVGDMVVAYGERAVPVAPEPQIGAPRLMVEVCADPYDAPPPRVGCKPRGLFRWPARGACIPGVEYVLDGWDEDSYIHFTSKDYESRNPLPHVLAGNGTARCWVKKYGLEEETPVDSFAAGESRVSSYGGIVTYTGATRTIDFTGDGKSYVYAGERTLEGGWNYKRIDTPYAVPENVVALEMYIRSDAVTESGRTYAALNISLPTLKDDTQFHYDNDLYFSGDYVFDKITPPASRAQPSVCVTTKTPGAYGKSPAYSLRAYPQDCQLRIAPSFNSAWEESAPYTSPIAHKDTLYVIARSARLGALLDGGVLEAKYIINLPERDSWPANDVCRLYSKPGEIHQVAVYPQTRAMGVPAGAIYVSADGAEQGDGIGRAPDSPCSFAHACEIVADGGVLACRQGVYTPPAAGTWTSSNRIDRNGITVIGGFDENWERTGTSRLAPTTAAQPDINPYQRYVKWRHWTMASVFFRGAYDEYTLNGFYPPEDSPDKYIGCGLETENPVSIPPEAASCGLNIGSCTSENPVFNAHNGQSVTLSPDCSLIVKVSAAPAGAEGAHYNSGVAVYGRSNPDAPAKGIVTIIGASTLSTYGNLDTLSLDSVGVGGESDAQVNIGGVRHLIAKNSCIGKNGGAGADGADGPPDGGDGKDGQGAPGGSAGLQVALIKSDKTYNLLRLENCCIGGDGGTGGKGGKGTDEVRESPPGSGRFYKRMYSGGNGGGAPGGRTMFSIGGAPRVFRNEIHLDISGGMRHGTDGAWGAGGDMSTGAGFTDADDGFFAGSGVRPGDGNPGGNAIYSGNRQRDKWQEYYGGNGLGPGGGGGNARGPGWLTAVGGDGAGGTEGGNVALPGFDALYRQPHFECGVGGGWPESVGGIVPQDIPAGAGGTGTTRNGRDGTVRRYESIANGSINDPGQTWFSGVDARGAPLPGKESPGKNGRGYCGDFWQIAKTPQ